MSEILQVPLVELEGSAPMPSFGMQQPTAAPPPTKFNMAEHPLIKQQIDGEIYPLTQEVRRNRQSLDEEWRQILRMEMMIHDPGGRRYYGRHDAYLPLWARAKKALVSNLSRGLFPSDEYLDVIDRASRDPEKAKPVKTLIQWEFERNANLRGNIKPVLSSAVSFGNTVIKHWYKKQLKFEGRSVPLGPYGSTGLQFGQTVQEGFAVSPRSIFSFYMWPTTATCIDDAAVVFEDIDLPRREIEKLIRSGKFLNGNAALEAPEPDVHQVNLNEIHSNYSLSRPQATIVAGNRLGAVRTLTEVWVSMELPPEALVQGEDPAARYPVRLVLAGPICVEARRNPFLHQRPPYEFYAANTTPGMVYGYGEGRMAKPTQYLANDFFNQTSDIAEYNLNPIIKYNPSVLVGQMLPLAPGRAYGMLDLNGGLAFDRPPFEMIQYGMSFLDRLMMMNKDNSGAPDAMQGISSKSGAATATGAQLLQRNAMMPLQDQVEDLEISLMVPMMRACWMYAQQWRQQATVASVAGQMMVVNPADLIIDPEFRWLASSQAVNQAQRAQNAMMLLQSIGPMIPYLNQIGYFVDPVVLLNRIYSDGFGFRGFSDFVRKVGMTPQGPMPMPGPNSIPPPMAEAQANAFDRARSTLEQLTGNDGQQLDMVPGEGEDFMNVRGQADAMAAMNGGNNGKLF